MTTAIFSPLSDRRIVLTGMALLALAGCSAPSPGIEEASEETLECALDGAEQFQPDCRILHHGESDRKETIALHPDGGFRRFDTLAGAAAGDGAIAASSQIIDGRVVVTIDRDRYRWAEGTIVD